MRVLRRSMENTESGNRSDSHKGRATQQQRKRTAQTKKKRYFNVHEGTRYQDLNQNRLSK